MGQGGSRRISRCCVSGCMESTAKWERRELPKSRWRGQPVRSARSAEANPTVGFARRGSTRALARAPLARAALLRRCRSASSSQADERRFAAVRHRFACPQRAARLSGDARCCELREYRSGHQVAVKGDSGRRSVWCAETRPQYAH